MYIYFIYDNLDILHGNIKMIMALLWMIIRYHEEHIKIGEEENEEEKSNLFIIY